MAKGNDGGERLRDEDLLIEVLSRLDVKTLLLCKSVSKTWYSLISTPIFIKSHLTRAITSSSSKDNSENTLIVRIFKHRYRREYPKKDGSYSLFELGGSDDFVGHLGYPYSKNDYPFILPSLLVGSVCGLVCVCVDPSADIDAQWCEPTAKKLSDIYIWNPATRRSKLIPTHTVYDDCDDTIKAALGFGFDPVDFDFKVVRVLSRDIFPEVYSAKENVWRNIETKLNDVPSLSTFDLCLHGFLFAIGENGMMAFDLNKEVFVCDVNLPVRSHDASFADFNDSIAVVIFNFKEKFDRIKLWTLDDEACLRDAGVKASWTMMVSIDVGLEFDELYGLFNNVELLLQYGEWMSYNIDKKVGRSIIPHPFFDFVNVFKYTESLVAVAGSQLVNWSDDEDDNKESSTGSEEVSKDSSIDSEVDNEDNNEESNVGVGLEDDIEENTADSEDKKESSVDSEDDDEEKNVNSGDE